MTKTSLNPQARRTFMLAAAVLPIASSCGHRPPPPPPPPLGRIAVIPAINVAGQETISFGGVPHPNHMHASRNHYIGPAIYVGAAARSVANWLDKSREVKAQEVAMKIAQIGYDPARHLNTVLLNLLREATLNIVPMLDNPLADQAREGEYAGVPPEIDAVLDVRFLEAGYYRGSRADGFIPYISASVGLWSPKDEARLGRYYYGAGPAPAKGDLRWFTTSTQLTVASLEDFGSRSAALRAGFESLLVERMLPSMVRDVYRRAVTPEAGDA